jgi:CheY-like chemotaxis protein
MVGPGLTFYPCAIDLPAAQNVRTTRIGRALPRLALVTIPINRRLRLEAGMVNSPSSYPHQTGSDRQATVLVVDDDPTLQTMILDYFVDNNIQTLLASGREEMLRQLSTQEVNVVILDLRLGVEDGLDALRELRSSFDVPVIIITGHRRDEIDRVVGLELGR